jgi:signal transduction histidine kinase
MVCLERGTFDVLLLDLSLPDCNGSETFLRARQKAPHIPIVILTGVDDENIGLDAIRHDAQDYLVKGYTDGRLIVRTLRYAIERKQMEDALKSLQLELEARVCERTAELAQVNEALQREMAQRVHAETQQIIAVMEERTRIAREIHDTIAQGLAGIAIQLETADFCLDLDKEKTRLRIRKAGDLARNSLAEARIAVWALRPPTLELGNLVPAIADLIGRLPHEASVTIDLTRRGTPYPLPSEMAHGLLRVCQEGLNNAIKHAQAQHIHVRLRFTAHQVGVCVADDGIGFDQTTPASQPGFGLHIMKERVARLSGKLTLTSRPGHGTHIDVRIPCVSGTRGETCHGHTD